MQETRERWVQFLGQEDPPEEEMTAHSSVLFLGNLMDRGAWWATVYGIAKSQTQLTTDTHTHTHTHARTYTDDSSVV